MLCRLPTLAACILSIAAALSPAAHAERVGHVDVDLVAERPALERGASNTLALRLRPDSGWHVYWRNPGDSGLPTRLRWTLPEGVSGGELQWPYPHPHRVDATLLNYGYETEVLHPVALEVAPGYAADTARVVAEAEWLVCSDVCIPGKATLPRTLPVQAQPASPDPALAAAFARTRAQLPAPLAGAARYTVADNEVRLALDARSLPADAPVALFAYANDLIAHAAPQRYVLQDGELRFAQTRSEYFAEPGGVVEGVLVVGAGDAARAYEFRATPGEIGPLPTEARVVAEPAAAATVTDTRSVQPLALMLLFAFLGGLVLNLMPCVFPVLSLKALALAQAGGASRTSQKLSALAYTAGVLTSFLAVAGLLLALRAGGASLGWGFQLQSPLFVAVLAYLLFVLGLSMSGMVEFGSRWMGAGQSLAAKPGHAGSFFTGVLAVVVASPCTAPFMGAALGFALTQPPVMSLAVFAALGLGLAAPFLLLGFVPALARRLPRPGAWMGTFRQVMAFPLYLTVAWLLWVLARQAGPDALGLALTGLVVLAFAVWLARGSRRLAPAVVGAVALLLLAHPLFRESTANVNAVTVADSDWQPYSATAVEAAAASGRTVFVNFTADWCLTCKLNERTTLSSTAVAQAFKSGNVALFKGDWTRRDPTITAALAAHERSGVPLYLLIRDGKTTLLPQLLTPGIVTDALAAADG